MLAKVGKSYRAAGWSGQRVKASAYHSATTGRRARSWIAPTLGPNDAILPNARTLVARSRAAVRNDGYARTALERLESNIVGTGIVPQSQAPDPEFRDRVEKLWLEWTDEADAAGLLDFYGLQVLAVREWLEGAEAFARLRLRAPEDGLRVPLQIELIESELCPVDHVAFAGNSRIRAGVEFSPIGRRQAFHFYRQRPGELQDLGTGELVRVPSSSVVHLFDPLRAGQIRGVPHLHQALLKLYDLDQYDDATLVRQKLANMFTGFIEQAGAAPEVPTDPVTGKPLERDDKDSPLVSLEPGLFHALLPGEKVTFSEPPDAPGYPDFMRAQLMGASVSAGVPYEVLTGDLRQVNDRTVRVILNEFRRRIEQRQHHIVAYQFNRPIWLAFMERAVLSGALEVPAEYFSDPRPWQRVEWVPPAWPYLHPVQDVEHEKAMVRAGFKSRTQVAKERGSSAEQIDREVAADNERTDKLKLVYDTDPRKVQSKGAPAAPPEPAPDGGGGEDRPADEDA